MSQEAFDEVIKHYKMLEDIMDGAWTGWKFLTDKQKAEDLEGIGYGIHTLGVSLEKLAESYNLRFEQKKINPYLKTCDIFPEV